MDKKVDEKKSNSNLPPGLLNGLTGEEEEVLKIVPHDFFTKSNVNVYEHILPKVPSEANLDDWFNQQVAQNERAFDIVNAKLLRTVLANYEGFVKGIGQITELGKDLEVCNVITSNTRRNLKQSKAQLLNNIAFILSNYRRKEHYQDISNKLFEIKRLITLKKQIDSAIEDYNFAKALELSAEAIPLAQKYREVHSLEQISTSLKETLPNLHERLETAITGVCSDFDSDQYQKIVSAYMAMGQNFQMIEKLKKFFIETIHTNATNVLYSHVLLHEDNYSNAESLKRMKFRELLSALPSEYFDRCLQTLMEVGCDIMYNHYRIVKWHEEHNESKEISDVRDELVRIRATMWDTIQKKLSSLLASGNLSHHKIDEFLRIMGSLNKFMSIGEEFSGTTDTKTLRNALKDQIKAYFRVYHKSRIEDLSTMLENEMWERIPVARDFTVASIYSKERRYFTIPELSNLYDGKEIFDNFAIHGNPFSKNYKGNDILKPVSTSTSKSKLIQDDDVDVEVEQVDESGESTPHKEDMNEGAIVTTTTINIIRFIGRYLYMMKLMQPIATDIFLGIVQLVEYYVYSIYTFFGEEINDTSPVSKSLRQLLSKLQKSFKQENVDTTKEASVLLPLSIRIPSKSSLVDTNDANALWGYRYKVAGVESINYIEQTLIEIRSELERELPKQDKDRIVSQFYNGTVTCLSELSYYILRSGTLKLVNWDQLIQMISNTKWDVKEVGVEYSPYVDFLLKEFGNMSKRITNEPLSKKSKLFIWEETLQHTMEQLVEGYGRIKKCTNEGRAIMSLDLKVFQNGVEKLSPLKPIPNTQYVDSYIKGFYINDPDVFANWCKEHKEYSLKLWMSLLNVSSLSSIKKKQKQDLIQMLEDLDRAFHPNSSNGK